jgi:hypothetical protein
MFMPIPDGRDGTISLVKINLLNFFPSKKLASSRGGSGLHLICNGAPCPGLAINRAMFPRIQIRLMPMLAGKAGRIGLEMADGLIAVIGDPSSKLVALCGSSA